MQALSIPRLALAHLPTPVHPLRRLLPALLPERVAGGLPTLLVKRDDLTGAALSGNKIRKLEFLLAEAQAQGADTLLTCGGAQSNHCRATALCAAQLGMRSLLLLRTADPHHPPGPSGNLLLDRLCGATVRFITPAQYRERGRLLEEAASDLRGAGHRPYIIPEGGSNSLGCWAYAEAVAELSGQLDEELRRRPLTLLCAVGSGGTLAGLRLGVARLGLPWRVAGVNVCDDRDYFLRAVREILGEAAARFQSPEAGDLAARDGDVDIRDGYVGRGYALSQPAELRLLRDACRSEGLVLDPVYTGKAVFGLMQELREDPGTFGDTVIFWHTGGVFGLFDEERAPELNAAL